MNDIKQLMSLCPVIPVLVIAEAQQAIPVAQALVDGGLRVIEVTLRTPASLEVIRLMRQVEGAIVGAGTVLNERQLDQALAAGADFIVSPGLTDALARAAIDRGIAFLPGAATASEIMKGLDLGFEQFKFFPAEALGGSKALRALAAPFAHVGFCPTGGINETSAKEWLAIPQVLCVGGSWLAPSGSSDYAAMRAAAKSAAMLIR